MQISSTSSVVSEVIPKVTALKLYLNKGGPQEFFGIPSITGDIAVIIIINARLSPTLNLSTSVLTLNLIVYTVLTALALNLIESNTGNIVLINRPPQIKRSIILAVNAMPPE